MYASPILPTRDAIVATAGESIARGSQSFALASRLFDRPTRERADAVLRKRAAGAELEESED